MEINRIIFSISFYFISENMHDVCSCIVFDSLCNVDWIRLVNLTHETFGVFCMSKIPEP